MTLTPIHVRGTRGKGRNKKTWHPPDPQKLKERKRQRKDRDGDDAAAQGRATGAKRILRERVRSPPALIERLPVEILERIFLLSENLGFPRSSHRIGYSLSRPSFRTALIVAAFGPTWDMWFGCPRPLIQSYHGYLEDHDHVGGNPKFQVRENLVMCL